MSQLMNFDKPVIPHNSYSPITSKGGRRRRKAGRSL